MRKNYHQLPFEGEQNFHRKGTSARAEFVAGAYDLKEKRGLDIGCAEGGISFCLQEMGAQMTAIDNDPTAIQVAMAMNEKFGRDVDFREMTVPSLEFNDLIQETWDFVVWFANFMWIVKDHGLEAAHDVLALVSENTEVLFFETAQSQRDGMAGPYQPIERKSQIADLLSKFFEDVDELGVPISGWNNRSIFMAKHR